MFTNERDITILFIFILSHHCFKIQLILDIEDIQVIFVLI